MMPITVLRARSTPPSACRQAGRAARTRCERAERRAAPAVVHGLLRIVGLEDAAVGREGGGGEVVLRRQHTRTYTPGAALPVGQHRSAARLQHREPAAPRLTPVPMPDIAPASAAQRPSQARRAPHRTRRSRCDAQMAASSVRLLGGRQVALAITQLMARSGGGLYVRSPGHRGKQSA